MNLQTNTLVKQIITAVCLAWTLWFSFNHLIATSHAASANGEWKPATEKNGVQTYLRKVPGSKYKAVRGETTLPLVAAKLVAVINDAAACPEWADLCVKSYIEEQVSPQESYIYTLNDMPWPVKDRDVLAHVRWQQQADGKIIMQSRATVDRLAKTKGVVRIKQANARWEFIPLANGETRAIFEIHMDPNGAIPGWLLNRLVVNSPFTTFKSLAKQAGKDKYAGAQLPF